MEASGVGPIPFSWPTRGRLCAALAVLAFVELTAFGIFERRLGFYVDDWVAMDYMRSNPGFLAGLRRFFEAGYATRPLGMLPFQVLFTLAGTKPLLYHAALLALDGAGAAFLYLFLAGLTGAHRLALIAAALAILYPAHPATHHWVTSLMQTQAQALALAGLSAHAAWLGSRRPGWLAWSCSLTLAALLSYESAAFLPLMLGAGLYARRRQAGEPPRPAAAAGDVLPLGLALLLGVLWQWLGTDLLFHISNAKSLHMSAGWFSTVYASAVQSLTVECVRLAKVTLLALAGGSEDAFWPLWLLVTLLSVRLLGADEEAPCGSPAVKTAVWAASGGFIASYLPFALTGGYEPQVVGIMSRTNGLGAMAAAILLAAAVCAVPGKRRGAVQAVLLGLLIGPALWTDWYIARQWGDAWTVQKTLLEKAVRWMPLAPDGSTVVLMNGPDLYNGTQIFESPYAWEAALRIMAGRKDLKGERLTPWMSSEASGLVERRGKSIRTLPYDRLFVYDCKNDRLFRPTP